MAEEARAEAMARLGAMVFTTDGFRLAELDLEFRGGGQLFGRGSVDEGKGAPRVSMAFALVMLGRTEISEFSPLQSLINNLNSAAYKGEAVPFLTELARDPAVRRSLYSALGNATKDEKIGIARVTSRRLRLSFLKRDDRALHPAGN